VQQRNKDEGKKKVSQDRSHVQGKKGRVKRGHAFPWGRKKQPAKKKGASRRVKGKEGHRRLDRGNLGISEHGPNARKGGSNTKRQTQKGKKQYVAGKKETAKKGTGTRNYKKGGCPKGLCCKGTETRGEITGC